MLACYDLAFPLQPAASGKKHKKARKPWVDKDLYERIKKKDAMCHTFIRKWQPELFVTYKKFRNEVQSDLKKAKCDYYERLFSNIRNNPRKVWDAVNEITGKNTNTHPQISRLNGREIERAELVSCMNTPFINAGMNSVHVAIRNNHTFFTPRVSNSLETDLSR